MKLPTKIKMKAAKRKVPPAIAGALGGLVVGTAVAAGVALKGKDLALKGAAVVGSWAERKSGT